MDYYINRFFFYGQIDSYDFKILFSSVLDVIILKLTKWLTFKIKNATQSGIFF
jgi:hypothetical protein